MRKESVRCVFCYAYRPGDLRDGGFAVNVFSDDTLSFSTYDGRRHLLAEQRFVLPAGTHQRVLGYIRAADDWLWNFPARMVARQPSRQIATVGLDGYALFQLEDFAELLNCGFLSTRGHCARLMFNLLEDIGAALGSCGFRLNLDSFGWNEGDPLVRRWQEPAAEEKPAQRRRWLG